MIVSIVSITASADHPFTVNKDTWGGNVDKETAFHFSDENPGSETVLTVPSTAITLKSKADPDKPKAPVVYSVIFLKIPLADALDQIESQQARKQKAPAHP